MSVTRFAGAVAIAMLSALPARCEETLIAVASNFAEVIETLDPAFETATGHTLTVTTGSTGKLYAQIVSGAPFDAMLAADQARPARLVDEGHAVAGSRFTYATGRLVLWSAEAGRAGPDAAGTLRRGDFDFLAIANPDLAPYGLAARQALTAMGLFDAVQPRLVMGQNIGQTFSMVATGNAELGLVAESQVLSTRSPAAGTRWAVPAHLHEPIRQDAVLLDGNNAAARAFLSYLESTEARDVIARSGYGTD